VSADIRPRGACPPVSYAKHGRERVPSTILVEALSHLKVSSRIALDVGAGSLSSAKYLLSAGFMVDAVDPDPYTAARAVVLDDPRLHLHRTDVRDMYIAPNSYSLAVALHVFHLLPRDDLGTVLRAVVNGLTEHGILCVTFLGTRDAWAPTPRFATVLHREELTALVAGLDVIRLDELEYDGLDVVGRPKHWHTYRCIFRKPSNPQGAPESVLGPGSKTERTVGC
jgi:hypothetical protein